MGIKSLMAAPLWVVRYRNEPACFHSLRHNIEQTHTFHYQGFDAHMSDDTVLHFRVQSTEYDPDTRGNIGVNLKP